MAKEDFNQVSSSFETVQCVLSSILCPSIFREIWRHCNGSPLLCPINRGVTRALIVGGGVYSYIRVLPD